MVHAVPTRPTERGEKQGILSRGPQTFKGSHEAFIFMIFTVIGCIFTLFPYLSLSQHCPDSISERLGRIIINTTSNQHH